jgi:anti-sigma B factor antagonist
MDSVDESFAMNVSVTNGARVVTIVGEIDLAVAPAMHAVLTDGRTDVIIDLSGVTFLDSSGIAAILRAYRQQTANGHCLSMRGATGPVRRVLQITGIDSVLPLAS